MTVSTLGRLRIHLQLSSSPVHRAGCLSSLSLVLEVCRMPESHWSSTHIGRYPRSWVLMAAITQGRHTHHQGGKAGGQMALLSGTSIWAASSECCLLLGRGLSFQLNHPGTPSKTHSELCVLVDSRSSLVDNNLNPQTS